MGWLPKRESLRYDYFDVSDDPIARERCNVPDTVTVTLDRLGLRQTGCALAVLRFNRVELVHEVWASADEVVLAEIAASSGLVAFVTLFEDGTIVKTAERDPSTWSWLHQAPGMRYHRADRVSWTTVVPPLDDVLARHRARIAATDVATVRATMQAYFATRIRSQELLQSKIVAQLVLALVLAGIVAVAASLAFVAHYRQLHARSEAMRVLAALLVPIVGLPTHHLMHWFVAPWIVRLMPGPRPRSAEALLEAASHVPPGRVYRYQ